MVDYGIQAGKVEVDNADIERFFVEHGYLNPDEVGRGPTSWSPSWDTLGPRENNPFGYPS